jgi:hypothetical protein
MTHGLDLGVAGYPLPAAESLMASNRHSDAAGGHVFALARAQRLSHSSAVAHGSGAMITGHRTPARATASLSGSRLRSIRPFDVSLFIAILSPEPRYEPPDPPSRCCGKTSSRAGAASCRP